MITQQGLHEKDDLSNLILRVTFVFGINVMVLSFKCNGRNCQMGSSYYHCVRNSSLGIFERRWRGTDYRIQITVIYGHLIAKMTG